MNLIGYLLLSLCTLAGFKAGFPQSPQFESRGRQQTDRLDLNAATLKDLRRLPGIGSVLAARIIEHRRKHGRFRRPQDIIIVRGMSAGLFRRIEPLIRTQ